jgi:hypothetical protein
MQEAQEDEREVLLSIYDGDSAFKQLSPKTFQYKVIEWRRFKQEAFYNIPLFAPSHK